MSENKDFVGELPIKPDVAPDTPSPPITNKSRLDDKRPMSEIKTSKAGAAKALIVIIAFVAMLVTVFIYRKQITTFFRKLGDFSNKKKDDD